MSITLFCPARFAQSSIKVGVKKANQWKAPVYPTPQRLTSWWLEDSAAQPTPWVNPSFSTMLGTSNDFLTLTSRPTDAMAKMPGPITRFQGLLDKFVLGETRHQQMQHLGERQQRYLASEVRLSPKEQANQALIHLLREGYQFIHQNVSKLTDTTVAEQRQAVKQFDQKRRELLEAELDEAEISSQLEALTKKIRAFIASERSKIEQRSAQSSKREQPTLPLPHVRDVVSSTIPNVPIVKKRGRFTITEE